MPADLLTGPELDDKEVILGRFRAYARQLVLPMVTEALSRGLTVEEFVEEFVATFEGPLPRVFRS